MCYQIMLCKSTSELLDDTELKSSSDTTFKSWHLYLHLICCVWDSLCRYIFLGYIEILWLINGDQDLKVSNSIKKVHSTAQICFDL